MIRGPLAVVLLLALCAGCGVRASNVIPGAAGPTVSTVGVPIYLVRDGKPVMVLRPSMRKDSTTALEFLANGVTPGEAARGFTTEVPAAAAPITFTRGSEGTATVSLAIPPTALSPVATSQIACTAQTGVRLTGGGVTTGPVYCPEPAPPAR